MSTKKPTKKKMSTSIDQNVHFGMPVQTESKQAVYTYGVLIFQAAPKSNTESQ